MWQRRIAFGLFGYSSQSEETKATETYKAVIERKVKVFYARVVCGVVFTFIRK